MEKDAIKMHLPDAIEFLQETIRIHSTSSKEQEAIQ